MIKIVKITGSCQRAVQKSSRRCLRKVYRQWVLQSTKIMRGKSTNVIFDTGITALKAKYNLKQNKFFFYSSSITIQKWWRMKLAQRLLKNLREVRAMLLIQSFVRMFLARQEAIRLRRIRSATTIQVVHVYLFINMYLF